MKLRMRRFVIEGHRLTIWVDAAGRLAGWCWR
jgi:hypothetical protein